MDVVDLRDDLRMLVDIPGRAYLVRRGDDVTLVDTGRTGSAAAIAAAADGWGTVRRVVLTHWHSDHTGSAAAVGAWPGVQVYAHRLDAPVVRGEADGPPPVLTAREEGLLAHVSAGLESSPPAAVDHEVGDGDQVDDVGLVVATPGHTAGSMALYLPAERILFTGDIAAESRGAVVLGPFNVDRAEAKESFRRLGDLPVDVVCFGHGEPLVGPEAAGRLAAAAHAPEVPDPLG